MIGGRRAPTTTPLDVSPAEWAAMAAAASRAPDAHRAQALVQIRLDLLAGVLQEAGRGAEATWLGRLLRSARLDLPAVAARRPGATARVVFEETAAARRARRRGRADPMHEDPRLWSRDLGARMRDSAPAAARVQGWSNREAPALDGDPVAFAASAKAAARSPDAVRAQALAQIRFAVLEEALRRTRPREAAPLERRAASDGFALPEEFRSRPAELLALAESAAAGARRARRRGGHHALIDDPGRWLALTLERPDAGGAAASRFLGDGWTDRTTPSFDGSPHAFAAWHRAAARFPDPVRVQAAGQVRLTLLGVALARGGKADADSLDRLMETAGLSLPPAIRNRPGVMLSAAEAGRVSARRARLRGLRHDLLDDPRRWADRAQTEETTVDDETFVPTDPSARARWAAGKPGHAPRRRPLVGLSASASLGSMLFDVDIRSYAGWARMATRLPSPVRAEALALIRFAVLERALRDTGRAEIVSFERFAAATGVELPMIARNRPGAVLLFASASVERIEETGLPFRQWIAAIAPEDLERALGAAAASEMQEVRRLQRRVAAPDQSHTLDHLRRLLRHGRLDAAVELLEAKRDALMSQPALRTSVTTLAARLAGETDPLSGPEVNAVRLARDLARRADSRLFDPRATLAGAHDHFADIREAADAFLAACGAPALWRSVIAHLPIDEALAPTGLGRTPAAGGFVSGATVKRARRSIEWFRAGASPLDAADRLRLDCSPRGGPALVAPDGRAMIEPMLTDRGDPALLWAALLARHVARCTGLRDMRGHVAARLHTLLLDDTPLWVALADAVDDRARAPGASGQLDLRSGWFARALAEARTVGHGRPITLVVGSDLAAAGQLAGWVAEFGPAVCFDLAAGRIVATEGVGHPLAELIRAARIVVTDVPGAAMSTALQGRPTLLVTASPKRRMRMPDLPGLRAVLAVADDQAETSLAVRRAFGELVADQKVEPIAA